MLILGSFRQKKIPGRKGFILKFWQLNYKPKIFIMCLLLPGIFVNLKLTYSLCKE